LFCRVHVGRLSGHEVQEAVELDEAAGVGVDDRKNALEVNFTLKRKRRKTEKIKKDILIQLYTFLLS
jgi:hypothetical protein